MYRLTTNISCRSSEAIRPFPRPCPVKQVIKHAWKGDPIGFVFLSVNEIFHHIHLQALLLNVTFLFLPLNRWRPYLDENLPGTVLTSGSTMRWRETPESDSLSSLPSCLYRTNWTMSARSKIHDILNLVDTRIAFEITRIDFSLKMLILQEKLSHTWMAPMIMRNIVPGPMMVDNMSAPW